MKNLKTIMLGLALLLVVGAANAAGPAPALSKNYVINTYVDAMTRGKLAGIADVLDKNASFNMLRGTQVTASGKKEMMDFLKANKNVEMECTTSTSIMENNADIALVKVDMKYSNSTRSNYVTMINTGSEGWKIINVYSVIK